VHSKAAWGGADERAARTTLGTLRRAARPPDRAMSFGVAAEPATDLSGGHYYWPPFSLLLGALHAAASLLVFENGTAAFDLVRAGHL